jgi:magnesium chelatase family protein
MNPCPCGHLGSTRTACRCTPDQVARYRGKLSGPLLDRIDLQIEVAAVPADVLGAAPDGEPSAAVAARVAVARRLAIARQGDVNARLAGSDLERHTALAPSAAALLQAASSRLGWSARGHHRTLRVARTVADLAGSATIEALHLAETIQLRRGLAPA